LGNGRRLGEGRRQQQRVSACQQQQGQYKNKDDYQAGEQELDPLGFIGGLRHSYADYTGFSRPVDCGWEMQNRWSLFINFTK
jgi:hypothetical protein